jgi:transposase
MIHITFTGEDQQALHYERFHYPDPRIQVKMEVLWLKSRGLDHAQIADLAGVSTRTVQRYLNEYRQGGLELLKQDRYLGPSSALEPHAVSLQEYFERHPPASVKEAQHVIEQQTGIRREESQVRAFLHRLGMRCRRMGTVPGKLTEEQQAEQHRFLEEELSPRLGEAEAGRRRVFLWMPAISSMGRSSAACGVSCVCS